MAEYWHMRAAFDALDKHLFDEDSIRQHKRDPPHRGMHSPLIQWPHRFHTSKVVGDMLAYVMCAMCDWYEEARKSEMLTRRQQYELMRREVRARVYADFTCMRNSSKLGDRVAVRLFANLERLVVTRSQSISQYFKKEF